jgi:phosphatidylglycerol:prolipoprotein diacylglycerol transferase
MGLPIRGYGVVLLAAVAAGVGLAVYRGKRLGIDPELMLTLAFWAFVPGIIGARAFYVIQKWDSVQGATPGETLLAIVNMTEGGLVVFGSVIGGMVGLGAFIYRYKMPPLATLDLVVPSFALGMAIGRIGCLLNGCCYGGMCDLPWAVTFPAGSPAHVHQVQHGETFLQGLRILGDIRAEPKISAVQPGSPAEREGLEPGARIVSINGVPVSTVGGAQRELLGAQELDEEIVIEVEASGGETLARWPVERPLPRTEPVHPTQVYSALNGLVLCLFLLAYAPFRQRDGELWAMFLTLYPITRFLLEILRTDEPGVFGTGLTISQVVSLILLVCAVAFWAHVWMKPPGTALPKYQPGAVGG